MVRVPVIFRESPHFARAPEYVEGLRRRLAEILEESTDLWFQEVLDYMLQHPGKMLRGLLVLFAYPSDEPPEILYDVGALVELLHVGSLLHDDVLDEAQERRGAESVNFRWSDKVAILVGDFVLTRIFTRLVQIGDLRLLDHFTNAARALIEGSLLEYEYRHSFRLREPTYLQLIERKTAALFRCGLRSMADYLEYPPEQREALDRFGYHLGMVFQITDDLLDYLGSSSTMGKPVLHDLREGYVTLPFLRAFAGELNAWEERWRKSGLNWESFIRRHEEEILARVRAPETLQGIRALAARHARQARAALPQLQTCVRERLDKILEWILSREY